MFPISFGRASRSIVLLSMFAGFVFGQNSPVASLERSVESATAAVITTSGPDDPAVIIANFAAAEAKVREALNQHMFKRDVVLQTIGLNGEVTGEYIRNSQFVFDDKGKRLERVVFHPKPTIHTMRITREDIQDLADGQLLGIDIVEAAKYRLTYAGIETLDSKQLYIVDIAPVVAPDPNHMSERYFVGRVWLDVNTFQIVRIKGIIEPQGKQRFPVFETWREPMMKDALLFPARTEADDVLHFNNGDIHYRIKVRYYDYKLFGSKVSIKEIDDPASESTTAPPITTAAPKSNIAPPSDSDNKERSKQRTALHNSEAVANQPVDIQLPRGNKPQTCATNRTAPPAGPYHWPADSDVQVYFVRNMFTPIQRAAMVDAMSTWSGASREDASGVKFSDAGETDTRMSCRGCLTVGRRDVYKRDRHHYAFFNPMEYTEGRLLVSAWIDLDYGITDARALKGFMVHELAHGLGLWDCTTCKKKETIMNGFPGINKDNGLVNPSTCDLATVKDIYQEERQLIAGTIERSSAASVTQMGARAANQTESAAPVTTSVLEPSALFPITESKKLFDFLSLSRPHDSTSLITSRRTAPPVPTTNFRFIPIDFSNHAFSPLRMSAFSDESPVALRLRANVFFAGNEN